MEIINRRLDVDLGRSLRPRIWRDEQKRLPRHLYPDRAETTLLELWRWEYDTLFKVGPPNSQRLLGHFSPATAKQLTPRYLADPNERWYAVILPRVNRRTMNRFCYLRYWWAIDSAAAATMVATIMDIWQPVPFDWLKLRLGDDPTFSPAEIHPLARIQSYVVAGQPERGGVPSPAALDGLRLTYPVQVQEDWWSQYCGLLAEQEQLASGMLDDWADYRQALAVLEEEMRALLEADGGVINMWRDDRLVGHISWRPDNYREQLIWRCWHINSVIVRADHRERGLGYALHRLALAQMNLLTTPIVAGLITGRNQASLRTAAKMGRKIVDQYVVIPKNNVV